VEVSVFVKVAFFKLVQVWSFVRPAIIDAKLVLLLLLIVIHAMPQFSERPMVVEIVLAILDIMKAQMVYVLYVIHPAIRVQQGLLAQGV